MKTLLTLLTTLAALILGPSVNAQTMALAPGHSVTIELKVPSEDAANVSSVYTVSAAGTIRLPYLNGEIRAAGVSPTDLARRIEQAYRTAEIYTNPTVNVVSKDQQINNIVTVGGAVKSGGREVPLRDGMTLYMAITAAGGPDEFAKLKAIRVIRGNREFTCDMRKVDKAGSVNNPVLQPNDQIIVPQD